MIGYKNGQYFFYSPFTQHTSNHIEAFSITIHFFQSINDDSTEKNCDLTFQTPFHRHKYLIASRKVILEQLTCVHEGLIPVPISYYQYADVPSVAPENYWKCFHLSCLSNPISSHQLPYSIISWAFFCNSVSNLFLL